MTTDFNYEHYLQPEQIEATRVALLSSFERYFKFMFYVVNEKPVLFKPFHKKLCKALDRIAKGKNEKRNLAINVPVGAGKSLVTEYWISWCFARSVNNAFVYTSYNNDLIIKLSEETRDICNHPNWVRLFGGRLKLGDASKTKWSFQNSANRTGLTARPMGGALTGLDCGNPNIEGFSGALVIDDPVDAVDGMRYPRTREECVMYYDDKLTTRRRTPTTPTVLIMQRLHKEDLTGWIKANEPEEWEFLEIPAIDEEGESFWPERYPVAELEKIKNINPYKFYAQYQQNPINAGGEVIKPEWFNYYTEINGRPDRVFITADTAQKIKEHNDYSVFMAWAVKDKKLHLLDMMRGKWEAHDLLNVATSFYNKYQLYNECWCHGVYIEDKASGTGLIQQLRNNGGMPIIGVPRVAGQDKLTRVEAGIPFLYQGDVLLPMNEQYGQNPALLSECASFQRDDSHSHDDMVDTLMDGIAIGLGNSSVSILDAI